MWMSSTNDESLDFWSRWEDKSAARQIVAFLASIFRTAQNWMDNSLSRAPGYHDRVAHIKHTDDEGGMNLTMPPGVIERLSARGECAGKRLWQRFDGGDGTELTWENHRWVRYRALMSVLEPYAGQFAERYGEAPAGARSIETMLTSDNPPPSYPWIDEVHHSWAQEETAAFTSAIEDWNEASPKFVDGAPEAVGQLRATPRV